MKRMSPEVLDYYDEELVVRISEKYGLKQLDALRAFLSSETYKMLSDPDLSMWDFGPAAIFDMWENERVTGDPRNSLYLRRDEE